MSVAPTLRAEVQAFSSKQGVDAALAESGRQEGVFRGQTVKEVDSATALANAAEEMTFAASEKVEKTLAQRKAGSKERLQANATDLAQKYVNMMTDPQAGRKLHAFLEALKKEGAMSESALRQLLGEHFADVSDQFAALSFAEESLRQEGGHDPLVTTLSALKAQLLRDAGAAIRSGLNIASDVVAFARTGLEGPDALRDLYRFAILGSQTIAALYQALIRRYGSAQFSQSLDFLLAAASSDLEGKALGSSLDPAQLKSAIDDIYHVQSLGNVQRSLAELLDTTRRLYPSRS